MNKLAAGVAAVVSIAACNATHAATFGDYVDYPTSISIEGEIVAGDDEALYNVIENRKAQGKLTEFLLLKSEGGMVIPAVHMAGLVRDERIKTIVGTDEYCASACAIIFAGGIERYVWVGGSIGVHGVSVEGSDAADGTVAVAKVFQYLGVPAAIIAKMVITTSSDMAWLTDADIEGWASVIVPDKPQVPQPAPQEPVRPTQTVFSMLCRSTETGTQYLVSEHNGYLMAGAFTYPVHSKNSGSVSGPTRWGTYQATFAHGHKQMQFWDAKSTAVDTCW